MRGWLRRHHACRRRRRATLLLSCLLQRCLPPPSPAPRRSQRLRCGLCIRERLCYLNWSSRRRRSSSNDGSRKNTDLERIMESSRRGFFWVPSIENFRVARCSSASSSSSMKLCTISDTDLRSKKKKPSPSLVVRAFVLLLALLLGSWYLVISDFFQREKLY